MSGPHDRLVRETFARPHAATWLLGCALAPLQPATAPTALPDAALLHGKERRADLAFDLDDIQLRVLVEHQSSPRRDMAARCLEHLVIAARSAQHDGTDQPLPRLHFLVLFQGPGRWTPPRSLAPEAPPLPPNVATSSVGPAYDVCHLEDLPLHSAPPDARIAVRVLLRAANAPRGSSPWSLTTDDFYDLQQVREQLGSSAIFTVISYLASISSTPAPENLMAQLQQQHPELAEDFISYNEQLRREGEQIGQQRGERIGQQRGERIGEQRAARQQRDLLIQLATQRFGEPTDLQRQRVQHLSPAHTYEAMTRLLTAASWDDLLG